VHVPLVGQNNSPHGKFPEQKNSPKRKILRFGTSIKRLERIGSDLVAFDLTRDIQHEKPLRTPMRWECCLKLTRISLGRPCVASAQQDAAVIVGVEMQLQLQPGHGGFTEMRPVGHRIITATSPASGGNPNDPIIDDIDSVWKHQTILLTIPNHSILHDNPVHIQ